MIKDEVNIDPISFPELRAQLDELLAAFDEIARFGRERRRLQQNHTDREIPR